MHTQADPTYDEWIRQAQVAARLGAWEVVLELYHRSYARYGTRDTGLFACDQYHTWHATHEEVRARIAQVAKDQWRAERAQQARQ